jgi:hypothetical protein
MFTLRATKLPADAEHSEWFVAGLSLGPAGDPLVLLAELAGDVGKGAVDLRSVYSGLADRPLPFRIVTWTNGQAQTVQLVGTRELLLLGGVQPLEGERWLLVRSRAESASEKNAEVHDSHGRLVSCFHAGDGIEDVQATSQGEIWISYFDEGVFGDLPLGQAGLVCLNASGQEKFRYSTIAERHGLPPIDDCYALNVAGDEDVWLYYYDDFPLVRLCKKQFDRKWHPMPVHGSHVFAVADGRALFVGSYNPERRLVLVSLESMEAEECRLVDEHGQHLTCGERRAPVCARGSKLLFKSGLDFYLADLRDLDR